MSKDKATVARGELMPIFLRTPYNYDTNQASDESGLKCLDDSKAKQSFQEECDINTIVKRFGITGQLPEGVRAPTYGDFTNTFDFHTAMNAIASARESFDRMPAEVRARFNNDPGAFVDFCSNEDNLAEMEKMGLTNPKPKTETPETVSPRPVTTSNGTGQDGKTVEAAPGGTQGAPKA